VFCDVNGRGDDPPIPKPSPPPRTGVDGDRPAGPSVTNAPSMSRRFAASPFGFRTPSRRRPA